VGEPAPPRRLALDNPPPITIYIHELVGAVLLRVDIALPVLAAAVMIALAAVELRLGRQERVPTFG
jgi:hypothetical protein